MAKPRVRSVASRLSAPIIAIVVLVVSVTLPAAAEEASPAATPPAMARAETLVTLPERMLELLGSGVLGQVATLAQANGLPKSKPPMARVIRSGPRSSGAVALTFDDGYNSSACARIADTLRKHGAVGTFFINGNYLKAEPAKWRRILAGMPVANHTRSHLDLTQVPDRVITKQIRENEGLHERILDRPMLKLLRPSYGAYDDQVRAIAYQLGYRHIVLWSVDTYDWERTSSVRSIVRRATGAAPGAVILMHCARNATAKALPAIIRDYRSRDIELAGLDEVLGL